MIPTVGRAKFPESTSSPIPLLFYFLCTFFILHAVDRQTRTCGLWESTLSAMAATVAGQGEMHCGIPVSPSHIRCTFKSPYTSNSLFSSLSSPVVSHTSFHPRNHGYRLPSPSTMKFSSGVSSWYQAAPKHLRYRTGSSCINSLRMKRRAVTTRLRTRPTSVPGESL